ncbi:hypothetical protein AAG570_011597 [Ranatra chinensis]|uniref:aralkylamine N-acetyltransferase n=1 Tax=Ranatra chinensis TaxID=642074 RepID=A0ABD0YL80_9HEMI
MGANHSDRAIHFLRKFFFKDEPLNICVGLLDEPGSTCAELERYCLESIQDGVSLMAVTPDDQLVGVCLSGIVKKEDAEDSKGDSLEECANPKFKKILNLLTTVSKECDIFQRYPHLDTVLEIRVVSVDNAYRGQGIAKALFDQTKKLAKELSVPMVRVDCTSHYSAMAVARLGFQPIYTLQYSHHLDNSGQPVFQPEPPHSCVKTFIMHVPT